MPMIGAKAHVARLRILAGAGLGREVGKALFAYGNLVQVEAQIGISTGAVSGKKHKPGPVGGYPNQDTAVLGNSIETNLINSEMVEVSANAPYAAAVHDGNSRTGARPFMDLARDATRKEGEQQFRDAIKRLVRQSRSKG